MDETEQLQADLRACRDEVRRQAKKLNSLVGPLGDLTLLHPIAREAFTNLAFDLSNQFEQGHTRSHFRAFEGFRSPSRQKALMAQRPPVTKAGMWQSAHQFGLAVDFVAFDGFQWSWADHEDWNFLHQRARTFGLVAPYEWDKCHIQHPWWSRYGNILRGQPA